MDVQAASIAVVRKMEGPRPSRLKRLTWRISWGGPNRSNVSRRSLLREAVEVLVSAQEQVLADGSGGGVELLVEPIRGEDFEFVRLLEHNGDAIPANEIDFLAAPRGEA